MQSIPKILIAVEFHYPLYKLAKMESIIDFSPTTDELYGDILIPNLAVEKSAMKDLSVFLDKLQNDLSLGFISERVADSCFAEYMKVGEKLHNTLKSLGLYQSGFLPYAYHSKPTDHLLVLTPIEIPEV